MIKIDLPPDFPQELLNPIELKKPPNRGYYLLSETEQEGNDKVSEELAKYTEQVVAEKNKKFKLLMDYYKVGTEISYEVFLYKFIEDILPGFKVQEPKKIGRQDKWDDFSYLLLWRDVTEIVLNKGHTVSAACNNLVKTPHWKAWLSYSTKANSSHTQSGKGLHNMYIQACKQPIVQYFSGRDMDIKSVLSLILIIIKQFQKNGLAKNLPGHPLLQNTFPETNSESL